MGRNRTPAPGGRPHVVGARLTNHEKVWVDMHRGQLTPGQYLVTCLHMVQAEHAREEREAQLGETD